MPLSYPVLYSDRWLDASTEKDKALSQGFSEIQDGSIEHGSHTCAYFQSTPYSVNQRSLAIDRHSWENREPYSPSGPEFVVLDLVNVLTTLTTTALSTRGSFEAATAAFERATRREQSA
jgi:hypothetical protein